MTDSLHIQIALTAPPGDIMRAWTAALPHWFAEHVDVSIAEKRYDFWGRYTPGAPDREGGRHPLLAYEPGERVRFGWQLRGVDTTVDVSIHPRAGGQTVAVRHEGVSKSHDIDFYTDEDFWFLTLENLRRHLDGKPPVRCDFSTPMVGDIQHSVEIDAAREAVFDALINPAQLRRWIATRDVVVEAHEGGRYYLGWGNNSSALKILDIVPNERLRLTWPEGDGQTVVTWTLEGSGGKTRLTLVHSGFAPDAKTGGLNAGWLNFMSWVKSMTEYGAGWQPAILRLSPGLESYYPASIVEGQVNIISEPI